MKEFLIADFIKITEATPCASSITSYPSSFIGVSTDSRTAKPGDCFFAIPGENFDGHDYICDAFAKGAACAVISKDIDEKKSAGKYLLRVKDTIKALGDLAGEYRRQAGFKVVAITGSAGKTTTKQIAYHALKQRFRVYQSPRSFNNKIGVPLTLLGADFHDQIVIAELGSNHPGEIAYLTRIAAPDIAIVTNVHPAHLEGFGDMQTIIQEKLSISEGLAPDGILIINADFGPLLAFARKQGADACRAKNAEFLTFGKSDGSNYQARDIRFDGSASRFTIDGTEVCLPLTGPGNVENALAAWAVCNQCGLTIDDFARAVKTTTAISMRAELLQIGTLTVLNDCYNANPASMKNALDILATLDSARKRRTVFICGDMAELGRHTEHLHADLGTLISQVGVRLLLAVGKFAEITANTAKASADYDLQIKCFDDTISACNNLHEFIKDNDIILVKGSRIARLEMAVEKLRELFS